MKKILKIYKNEKFEKEVLENDLEQYDITKHDKSSSVFSSNYSRSSDNNTDEEEKNSSFDNNNDINNNNGDGDNNNDDNNNNGNNNNKENEKNNDKKGKSNKKYNNNKSKNKKNKSKNKKKESENKNNENLNLNDFKNINWISNIENKNYVEDITKELNKIRISNFNNTEYENLITKTDKFNDNIENKKNFNFWRS